MPIISSFGSASSRGLGFGAGGKFGVTGGTRSEIDIAGVSYTLFTFTDSGTLEITGGGVLQGTVLAVRAGGNGGSAPGQPGGSGGSGGALIQTTRLFRAGTHSVTRGAASAGQSSILLPYGSPVTSPTGNAGGGGSGNYFFNFGNPAGTGQISTITGEDVYYGGGGGGGGTGGAPPNGYPTSTRPGRPGGLRGGGPGGSWSASPPGGAFPFGNNGNPGQANTGGGGGGGGSPARSPSYGQGGSGGTGIVIVRFLTGQLMPA